MSAPANAHERPLERALLGLQASLGLKSSEASRLVGQAGPMLWIAAGDVIRWDEGVPGPKLIVRGWACESRTLPNGRKQLFDFLLPGDIAFPQATAPTTRFEVRALTATRVLCLGMSRVEPEKSELVDVLARAYSLNLDRRYNAAVRLGRLTAEERTLDLLEEFRERLAALDLVKEEGFRLPLTQVQLADALGVSAAHFNRTLAALSRRALVEVRSGQVRLRPPSV